MWIFPHPLPAKSHRLCKLASLICRMIVSPLVVSSADAALPTIQGELFSSSTTAASAHLGCYAVNANGSSTTISFEYGTDTSYGSTVVSSGTLDTTYGTPVSVDVSNLLPSTTYHFRCKAENLSGAVYSGDATFSTRDLPVVTTGEATNVSDLGATLNSTVDSRGVVLTVSFQYGTSSSYGQTAAATPSNTTSTSPIVNSAGTISKLTPATLYHYRVVAKYGTAYTYVGDDRTFTTGPPSTPPAVTTNTPGSIKTTSAVLFSSVTANALSADVAFDYGIDTSYGSSTAIAGTVSAGSNGSPNIALGGLLPNTIYHVRAKATNSLGTSYGQDRTFTTLQEPAVNTLAASSVADLSVTFNGMGNPRNSSYTASFEYGTTTAYGSSKAIFPSIVSGNSDTALAAAITNLLPSTTYHYRLKFTDNVTTYYGADVTVTTTAPATPPSVTSASATVTAITATLKATTVNSGSSAALVWFEYGPTAAYGNSTATFAIPFNTTAPSIQFPLTGFQPGTTLHYRVRASNSEGNYMGADQTLTTAALPTVTTGAATSVTDLRATLNATVNPAGVSSTLSFEYGPTSAYGSTVNTAIVTGTSSVTKSSSVYLGAASTFHYRAKLTNDDGTYYGADMTVTTPAAGTPPSIINAPSSSNIAATGVSITQTGLVIGSSTATLVLEYGPTTAYGAQVIYPTPLAPGIDKIVTMALTGLAPGTTYHYRARLTNQQGTATGADGTFTTCQLPVVTTGNPATVNLTSATLQGSANAGGGSLSLVFQYWASTADSLSTSSPTPSTATGSSTVSPTATPTTLLPGIRYFYRLVGTDRASVVYNGEIREFTTPALGLPSVIAGQATSVLADAVTISTTAVQPGAPPATVTIEYGTTSDYGSVTEGRIVQSAASLSPSFKLQDLSPETTYHYRATIVDASGTFHGGDMQFTTAAVSLTTTTSVAQSITSTGATLNGTFKLNAGPSVASFEYGTDTSYGSSISASSQPLAATSGTYSLSAVPTNLLPGTLYHYRAVQVNPYGTVYGADQTFTTLASDQPVAITDSTFGTAQSGTSTGTILVRGTVKTSGLPASVFVQYNTQGGIVMVAATPATVPAGAETSITASLAGITTSAGCNVRVIAINSAGTSYGAYLIGSAFDGAKAPSISVRSLSDTAATIYTPSSGVVSSSASYVEYGLTAAYGNKTTSFFPLFTLGSPTALQPETTYHYRVVLADGFGTVWYSDDLTLTTDVRAPVINSFQTSAITDTSADLTVSTTPYANESLVIVLTEIGNPSNVFTSAPTPGIAPASATTISTASFTGLKPGATYSYKVKGTHLNPMGFDSSNTKSGSTWRFTTLTRAENWRRIHFGSTTNDGDAADDASPRHDGIPNLMKYALGIDPVSTIAALPPAETGTYEGGSFLRYRFPRDPLCDDIIYLVEAADSPAGPWSEITRSAYGAVANGPGFVSETPSGNKRIVEVRDTVGIQSAQHRFMRLRVTR